jgi:transmembrane sensor
MKKFSEYETNDFLKDESFINWALDPDGEGGRSWQAWMNANPDKSEAAQKAIDIIRSLDFKQETVADDFYVTLKQRIDLTNIAIQETHTTLQRDRPFVGMWDKVAAGIVGLVLCIIVLYSVRKPSYAFVSTPYAAIKTVWLPDSSEVILNANSSIRFQKGKTKDKREVWVTGEAFFKVRHIDIAGNAQPFEVHIGDAVIEVLGTEFNVKNIDNTTGVLLREGKVRFWVPASNAETIMQPNDYCLYDEAQKKIVTRVANPVLFTSWMEHKYRFENTTIKEVCETLRAYYGYDFIIRNDKPDTQTFSGTLELQDEQVMLQVLGELFGAKVVKQNDQVIIE